MQRIILKLELIKKTFCSTKWTAIKLPIRRHIFQSSTIKQRQYYRHEIIYRNIDRRFTITQIKQILRQQNILFNAVNVSTSSMTRKTSLYVGVKNPNQIKKYENDTWEFFTIDHYNSLSNEFKCKPFHGRRLWIKVIIQLSAISKRKAKLKTNFWILLPYFILNFIDNYFQRIHEWTNG
jgi:hypothetical protein